MAMFHTTVLDNQIKALPTVSTASGSVANFTTDKTENLVEVECEIIYQQASGTPSPQDEKPILTFDDLTLYHNDINLWNEEWELGMINRTTGELEPSTNRIRSVSKIPCKENTAYYFKSSVNIFVVTYDINGNVVESPSGGMNFVYTTKPNVAYMMFYTATGVTSYDNSISINYPSTDTTYHAFNGAYIPFGQTVAKGKLNVTTGVLKITHAYADLSTLSWIALSGDRWYTMDLSSVIQKPASNNDTISVVCSILVATSTNDLYLHSDVIGIAVPTNGFLQCRTGDTVNTPTGDLVYPLTTPIEIQLDSNTITALLNENNIWCDTNGNTTVKFLLTVGKAIT